MVRSRAPQLWENGRGTREVPWPQAAARSPPRPVLSALHGRDWAVAASQRETRSSDGAAAPRTGVERGAAPKPPPRPPARISAACEAPSADSVLWAAQYREEKQRAAEAAPRAGLPAGWPAEHPPPPPRGPLCLRAATAGKLALLPPRAATPERRGHPSCRLSRAGASSRGAGSASGDRRAKVRRGARPSRLLRGGASSCALAGLLPRSDPSPRVAAACLSWRRPAPRSGCEASSTTARCLFGRVGDALTRGCGATVARSGCTFLRGPPSGQLRPPGEIGRPEQRSPAPAGRALQGSAEGEGQAPPCARPVRPRAGLGVGHGGARGHMAFAAPPTSWPWRAREPPPVPGTPLGEGSRDPEVGNSLSASHPVTWKWPPSLPGWATSLATWLASSALSLPEAGLKALRATSSGCLGGVQSLWPSELTTAAVLRVSNQDSQWLRRCSGPQACWALGQPGCGGEAPWMSPRWRRRRQPLQ